MNYIRVEDSLINLDTLTGIEFTPTKITFHRGLLDHFATDTKDKEKIKELKKWLLLNIPYICITDVVNGFPTITDEEFKERDKYK